MELMLLKFFDWEVGLVTPAHFINFYVHSTCVEMECDLGLADEAHLTEQKKRIADSIKSYARFLHAPWMFS